MVRACFRTILRLANTEGRNSEAKKIVAYYKLVLFVVYHDERTRDVVFRNVIIHVGPSI